MTPLTTVGEVNRSNDPAFAEAFEIPRAHKAGARSGDYPNQTDRRRARRLSSMRWIAERTSSESRLTRIGSSASPGP